MADRGNPSHSPSRMAGRAGGKEPSVTSLELSSHAVGLPVGAHLSAPDESLPRVHRPLAVAVLVDAGSVEVVLVHGHDQR
jgi:hypothetical protein